MKKNDFRERSTNKVEETTSFHQSSNPFSSETIASSSLSIQYFFAIEEENTNKFEMLGRIVEENA